MPNPTEPGGKATLALLRTLRDHAPPHMPTSARYVLVLLLLHADGTGGSFPSLDMLARESGLSRRGLVKVLAWLEGHGLLLRTKGGGRGRRNSYFVNTRPEALRAAFEAMAANGKRCTQCTVTNSARSSPFQDKNSELRVPKQGTAETANAAVTRDSSPNSPYVENSPPEDPSPCKDLKSEDVLCASRQSTPPILAVRKRKLTQEERDIVDKAAKWIERFDNARTRGRKLRQQLAWFVREIGADAAYDIITRHVEGGWDYDGDPDGTENPGALFEELQEARKMARYQAALRMSQQNQGGDRGGRQIR